MNLTNLSSASCVWIDNLLTLSTVGELVTARGMTTKETMHNKFVVDMSMPVNLISARKLNYSFMAQEALWIIEGCNDLQSLLAVNPNMKEFSDNGASLMGAYGPKIFFQRQYIVESLLKDESTRQAVLTIWERNPPVSKDIPCTVCMQFMIR